MLLLWFSQKGLDIEMVSEHLDRLARTNLPYMYTMSQHVPASIHEMRNESKVSLQCCKLSLPGSNAQKGAQSAQVLYQQ